MRVCVRVFEFVLFVWSGVVHCVSPSLAAVAKEAVFSVGTGTRGTRASGGCCCGGHEDGCVDCACMVN